jgi:hypothetical protein
MESYGTNDYVYLPVFCDPSDHVPDQETSLPMFLVFHSPDYED